MMEVVVIAGSIRCAKLQPNCHHQQTNTQLSTGQMPFLSPNQQCQSTEGKEVLSFMISANVDQSKHFISVRTRNPMQKKICTENM